MKKLFTFSIVAIFFSAFSFSQNTFIKAIPIGVQDEVGWDIISKSDKSFVIAGYNTTVAGNAWKSCLVNVDAQGNFVNKSDLGASSDNGTYRFRATSDGGYIMVGYNFNVDSNAYQMLVIKANSSMSGVWEKEIAVSPFSWSEEPFFDILQASDGNFVVAGHTDVGGERNAYVLKLDPANGNVLWQFKYGKSGENYNIQSIKETSDMGYILCGFSNVSGTNSVLLMKLNTDGTKQWDKLLSGGSQVGRDVVEVKNGYAVAGKKLGSTWEAMLMKTTLDGSLLWSKVYGDGNAAYDDIFSIDKTPDGGFVITGYVGGSGNDKEVYIVRTDSGGTKKWSKTYGLSSTQDVAYSVKKTTDGGIVATGYTNTGTLWDMLLIKTDARGNENCNNFPSPVCLVSDSAYVDSVVQFNTTVIGGNGSVTYDWKGDDGFSSTAQNPTHTYTTPGNYYYWLETKDGNNCYGICGGKIMVKAKTGTGIAGEQMRRYANVQMIPNPFSENVELQITNYRLQIANCELQIYNLLGKEVKNYKLQTTNYQLDLKDLPNGIYFYHIADGKQIIARGKIAKQ